MSKKESLEQVVEIYHNSKEPDSITTKDIIGAFGTPIMPNFTSFKNLDYEGLAISPGGTPIIFGGEATFRFEKKKKDEIETIEKKIIVVGQNGRLLTPESLIFSRKMYREAEKKKLNLLLLTNTEGGEVMEHAALMGQSYQVSENIMSLLNLKANIASLVVRIGGSGGGLCNQVCNPHVDKKRPGTALMMENAIYPVISPQHCRSILLKSNPEMTEDEATKLLLPTPKKLKDLGIIHTIVPEYVGGSHAEKIVGFSQTLRYINDSLAEIFLDFENNPGNLEKIVKSRLEHSCKGYAELTSGESWGEFAKKYIPGKKVLKKVTKETTLAELDAKFNEIGAGNPALEAGIERKRKELEKEEVDSMTPSMECGDQDKDGEPGKIVEVDEDKLKFLRRKYLRGEMEFVGYMQEKAEILEKNHILKTCTGVFSKKVFEEVGETCPDCGKGRIWSGWDWIWNFVDGDSDFYQLNSNLDVNSFKPTIYHTPKYLEEIAKAQEKSGNKSALITGMGKVYGMPVMFGAFDYSFMGGSFGGIVEPKKFYDAVEFAKKKVMPFVLISSSGGARMQEGTLSLKGMESTNASIQSLRDANVPYMVVLANPTFGGTPASLAAQGQVTLAEKGLRYGFTGPRVIELALESHISEKELPEKMKSLEFMMMPDVLKHIEVMPNRKLIDFVGLRNELKPELGKYLSMFYGGNHGRFLK